MRRGWCNKANCETNFPFMLAMHPHTQLIPLPIPNLNSQLSILFQNRRWIWFACTREPLTHTRCTPGAFLSDSYRLSGNPALPSLPLPIWNALHWLVTSTGVLYDNHRHNFRWSWKYKGIFVKLMKPIWCFENKLLKPWHGY